MKKICKAVLCVVVILLLGIFSQKEESTPLIFPYSSPCFFRGEICTTLLYILQ